MTNLRIPTVFGQTIANIGEVPGGREWGRVRGKVRSEQLAAGPLPPS
ncbi:hypothetical protein OG788_46435 [Streptomyces sp. NBC_00647]